MYYDNLLCNLFCVSALIHCITENNSLKSDFLNIFLTFQYERWLKIVEIMLTYQFAALWETIILMTNEHNMVEEKKN